MIFSAFFLALAQMRERRFLRAMGWGMALALGLFVAVYVVAVLLLQGLLPDEVNLWLIGPVHGLQGFFGWATLGVMVLASVFLMVPVAAAFAGFFLDGVAQAVEDRHYPHLPPARTQGMAEALKTTINLMGLILALNGVLFILMAVIGPLAPVLYFAVNGYLLGKEYFTTVALRRMEAGEAKALFRAHRGRIWLAGVLMTFPLLLPVVNLAVPVLGTATFTHIFHRLASGRR